MAHQISRFFLNVGFGDIELFILQLALLIILIVELVQFIRYLMKKWQ
jgi:hypothetical protein